MSPHPKEISRESLTYIYHHVFLPPKLPNADDSDGNGDGELCSVVLETMEQYQGHLMGDESIAWASLRQMVRNAIDCHGPSTRYIRQDKLQQLLRQLPNSGGHLALHVGAQNAGVMISSPINGSDRTLCFEAFELSPSNKAVLSSKGRLCRSFPECAIRVDSDVGVDPEFVKSISHTIAVMSHQTVAGQLPQAYKARQWHDEDRDTAHPAVVTGFLRGLLTGLGSPLGAQLVTKNCREEVMYDNARSPWRRSPTWLLLRVSMQLALTRLQETLAMEHDLYKNFMLYLTARLLRLSNDVGLPSDVLHAMHAKVTRRLLKLGKPCHAAMSEEITKTVQAVNSTIANRWQNVQHQYQPQVSAFGKLGELHFERDSYLHLPELKDFISSIAHRKPETDTGNFMPPLEQAVLQCNVLPELSFPKGGRRGTVQGLQGFETWVAQNLTYWVEAHLEDANACCQSAALLRLYHSIAEPCYADNPEATSIMLLVGMELWIACDQLAISIDPLLASYAPGVPRQPLQNLLLLQQEHLIRLGVVEEYLHHREGATRPSELLFTETKHRYSFPYQYFEKSLAHQELYREILSTAEDARKQKVDELLACQAEYKRVKTASNQWTCEYDQVFDTHTRLHVPRHKATCQKCQYLKEMAEMTIDVHEWPLPANEMFAKTVVFELRVPAWFGDWRDVTMHLRLGLFKAGYVAHSSTNPTRTLSQDPHLAASFVRLQPKRRVARIGLISETKAHLGTHRRGKAIATCTESDVCVANGLHYRYFDFEKSTYVGEVQEAPHALHACTYKLPRHSEMLQKFIFRTAEQVDGPSPNTVIAEQSLCPEHMTLHEFKALASLPLDHELQWWNILGQLGAPSVDFKKPETALVIQQCIFQVGPPVLGSPDRGSESIRPSHHLLSIPEFSNALLDCLHTALERICANWESLDVVALFVAIAARLLAATGEPSIRDRCLQYLAVTRNLAMDWALLLRERVRTVTGSDRDALSAKCTEAALVCASTYGLDKEALMQLLRDKNVASMLIQSSMMIHDGERHIALFSDDLVTFRHLRHQRLLCDTYTTLAGLPEALDDAVHKAWSGYRSGGDWKYVDGCRHWVSTKTNPAFGQGMEVLLNLLSGELLVNGLPLDRLPKEYERHPTYTKLFGQSEVEVMPSNIPGMRFSSKEEHHGHQLDFGLGPMSDPGTCDFRLRAHVPHKANELYELVPAHVFSHHLPASFVSDYVHWYNPRNKRVEFRPSCAPWESCTQEQWELVQGDDLRWRLRRQNSEVFLLGMHGPTALALASILSPLARQVRIHTLFLSSLLTVEVNIPHLRLTFSLRQGQSTLQSREFAGHVVDPVQVLGTLIGLQNKLLLRNDLSRERMILIPQGPINFARSNAGGNEHVDVSVDLDTADKALPFRVDDRLGRLVDKGHLRSKLILAYLHALTSYCRPDPLTSLTGTEQALTILRSSAVHSFESLTASDVDVLRAITQLTPSRAFYPPYERTMQTVHWSDQLSFLSQHPEFHSLVLAIYDQARQRAFLYPLIETQIPEPERMSLHLLDRARLRSSTLWVSEYGAEDFTTRHDERYSPRHSGAESQLDMYRRAYIVADKMHRKRDTTHRTSLAPTVLWDHLQTCGTLPGLDETLDMSLIKYDGSLFRQEPHYLGERWLHLLQGLVTNSHPRVGKLPLMTWLSALACSETMDESFVESVANFYTTPTRFQPFDGTTRGAFEVSNGHVLTHSMTESLVVSHLKSFRDTPLASWQKQDDERERAFRKRIRQTCNTNGRAAARELATDLVRQWPTQSPNFTFSPNVSSYVDTARVTAPVQLKFSQCHRNLELFSYLQKTSAVLESLDVMAVEPPHHAFTEAHPHEREKAFISSDSLIAGSAPDLSRVDSPNGLELSWDHDSTEARRVQDLTQLIAERDGLSVFELTYAQNLESSVSSLHQYPQVRLRVLPSDSDLLEYLRARETSLRRMEDMLLAATSPSPDAAETVAFPALWPRLRPQFFLRLLHRDRWSELSQDWKVCMVRYAAAHTMSQRARRLASAKVKGDDGDLTAELRNAGHENWSPYDHPEWLLLEVESNIMIRSNQASIAMHMIDPEKGQNVSMQLNMGEGKSSTIVPMAACALSDRSQIVRVIVAKPQSKQMAQMMVAKLGGMLDRKVYYLPFARDLKVNSEDAHTVLEIYRECQDAGGVLLVQPEHILSLQLMCVESYISGHGTLGARLVQTQDLSTQFARDIIDESDENFSTKYELIYTIGTQKPIQMTPDRWVYIQQLFDAIRDVTWSLAHEYPRAVEIKECEPHMFPRIRILDRRLEKVLADRLGTHVCEHGLPGLVIAHQPTHIREAIHTFITESTIGAEESKELDRILSERLPSDHIKTALLLLRGLLAGGVIGFALGRKRWRVNYGLDFSRKPATYLAVPYRAKDMPSLHSEFSHPDVVMLLTCLSYYYGGLDDDMIDSAFKHLLDSDQRDTEYREWVKDISALDDCFRQLDGINLKDKAQCASRVFPLLRRSKPLIDYYLSRMVFPREMKEFPSKLSASGWDLGKIKGRPTSAFSGTSDLRHLLPLDMTHLSLPEQEHTNALVLHYLLQPENDATVIPDSPVPHGLLDLVETLKPTPRVILDVGAQILEPTNLEVARKWLSMQSDETASAAVFVNDNDELSVIDRSDYIEPLQTSPFADRLDSCLVFLDEAHTRGIDLKLPRDYRAAVTLGPNLTKDRLVQACMRLRKLGHGQSVTFCAPREVHDRITACASKPHHAPITVPDVLAWAIEETCADFQRSLPLWAIQGNRFARQEQVWEMVGVRDSTSLSKDFAERFLEDDAQSIESRYALRHEDDGQPIRWSDNDRMCQIQMRVDMYQTKGPQECAMQEEQERELAPETEQERQIEKPPPANPAPHALHDDVVNFVLSGTVSTRSKAYMHAFKALSGTSAAQTFDVSQLRDDSRLLATTDFARTIATAREDDSLDSFQRPVQWLLIHSPPSSSPDIHSRAVADLALIISPFEAQRLFPLFRTRPTAVTLHLYKPRWNLDHLPLEDLRGFAMPPGRAPPTLPPSLSSQLNLFAGRLYFASVADFERACEFLGLTPRDAGAEGVAVMADGFVVDRVHRRGACSTLRDNPLAFIGALLQIRRDGLECGKTHMGRLVRGDLGVVKAVRRDVG